MRVIVGATFRRSGASGLHDLARALRSGSPSALEDVGVILRAGLRRAAPDIAAAASVVVVPMAGHRAGSLSGAAGLLAEQVLVEHPQWTVAHALERVSDVAPATAADGPRDALLEAGTLRWRDVPGEDLILLVDDVVHTGASVEAARLAASSALRARLAVLVAFRAED